MYKCEHLLNLENEFRNQLKIGKLMNENNIGVLNNCIIHISYYPCFKYVKNIIQ